MASRGERKPGRLAAAALRASGGSCEPRELSAVTPRPRRADKDEPAFELWLARQTQRWDPVMAPGVARQLLRSRASFLGAVASVATLGAAQLAWLAGRGHETFATFGDALLWSAATIVAMQGDPGPATAAGRLIMLAGFAVGLVVIATLAGVVGTYLLEDRRERAAADGEA